MIQKNHLHYEIKNNRKVDEFTTNRIKTMNTEKIKIFKKKNKVDLILKVPSFYIVYRIKAKMVIGYNNSFVSGTAI